MLEKMDPAIKTKWLTALRSGEFTQMRMALGRGPTQRCCLGVLAQCIAPSTFEGVNIVMSVPDDLTNNLAFIWANDAGDLFCELGEIPYDVAERLALNQHYTEYGGTVMHFLISRNDNQTDPWTFTQIADWIEENL